MYGNKKQLKNRDYDINISEGSSNGRKFSTSNGQKFEMDIFCDFKFYHIRINSFRALVLLEPKQDQAFFS